MNSMVSELASAARLLVAITFHFDTARVGFLAEVLRSLAEYPVGAMKVVILTNTGALTSWITQSLGREVFAGKVTLIESHANLSNPWHLTWCHKP